MKKSAVFINVGRGDTVVEEDLIKALHDKIISGAVLDVYRIEPLPKDSPLWQLPNVLMYPHCADDESTVLDKMFALTTKNIEALMHGKPLINVCDKKLGY